MHFISSSIKSLLAKFFTSTVFKNFMLDILIVYSRYCRVKITLHFYQYREIFSIKWEIQGILSNGTFGLLMLKQINLSISLSNVDVVMIHNFMMTSWYWHTEHIYTHMKVILTNVESFINSIHGYLSLYTSKTIIQTFGWIRNFLMKNQPDFATPFGI